MEHPNVAHILRELIQTSEDGKEGFQLAAEASDNPDLKILLEHYSRQREGFSEELHRVASAYGDAAYDEGTSAVGALHRGWLNIRSAISAKDPASILAECERGEDHAVAAYEKALGEGLPPDVVAVIAPQSHEVKEAHDKIKHLRDLAKAA